MILARFHIVTLEMAVSTIRLVVLVAAAAAVGKANRYTAALVLVPVAKAVFLAKRAANCLEKPSRIRVAELKDLR